LIVHVLIRGSLSNWPMDSRLLMTDCVDFIEQK
jgi:hypothetical protein